MRASIVYAAALAGAALIAQQANIFSVLKGTVATGKQPDGVYLVPTSQMLHPWGEQNMISGRPVDMAFDSGKRMLAVLNTNTVQFFDGSTGTKVAEVPTAADAIVKRATSYAGIAFRPGNRELWASETTANGPDSILIAELSDVGLPVKTSRLALQGHPTPVGIAFSPDGGTTYVAFSRANALAVIDASTHEIRKQVDVGMAPFGVAVSKLRGKVFVTNRGGRRPVAGDTTAPSSGSAILTDPVTGSTASGTLSMVDAATLEVREVPVGLEPSQLALNPDESTLAVANSHSDSVSFLDTVTLARTNVKIPTFSDAALGSQPIGLAFAPDGKTLYVACGGNNAVAALAQSGKNWNVAGALPTAWFPSAIAIDGDGALRVLNIKGVGNTANRNGNGTFNSRQYEGSLEKIPAPTPLQLTAGAREVKLANSPVWELAGGIANLASLGVEHVFLIVKENRTYDQVLGDLPKANGDPKLVMYGRDVTPNHHALAENFVTLDNYYTSGAISFDGHQWLMQAFVSDYVERAFAASPRGYAFDMSDSLVVAPTGFFWQGGTRPLGVRIFGEFQLPARWDPVTQSAVVRATADRLSWSQCYKAYKDGSWESVLGARSGVPALAPYCSKRFPGFVLAIPDQIRAEEFLRELAEHEKTGQLQNLTIIALSQDHTSGTRPGGPTPKAMVADDDLALGRIVEGISKSRFWAKSLILVTEDDAQDGVDHVNGYRTVALAIGPFIRRGVVDSNNYNHLSLIRTIQEIFRIPARTRFLKAARPMNSIFTAQADTRPYEHLIPKQAIDEMNPPLQALDGRRLLAARQSLAMNFSEADAAPAETLNHILWWDAKGYDAPYPKVK
jgi:YVTN family beta-propeller protein